MERSLQLPATACKIENRITDSNTRTLQLTRSNWLWFTCCLGLCCKMWYEILPSFAIVGGLLWAPHGVMYICNKLAYKGHVRRVDHG